MYILIFKLASINAQLHLQLYNIIPTIEWFMLNWCNDLLNEDKRLDDLNKTIQADINWNQIKICFEWKSISCKIIVSTVVVNTIKTGLTVAIKVLAIVITSVNIKNSRYAGMNIKRHGLIGL